MNDTLRLRIRRVALAGLVLVGLVLALNAVPYRIAFDPVERSCLPYSVYLLDLAPDAPPAVGEIVSYRAEGMGPYFPDGTMMAKLVLAGPGDRVLVREDAVHGPTFSVGGLHPPILEKLGRSARSLVREVTLGPNEYFLVGTSANAFDSRYTGPVRVDQIVGKDTPLW